MPCHVLGARTRTRTRARTRTRTRAGVQALLAAVMLTVSVAASAQTDSVPGDGAAIEITPLVHSSVQIAYRGTVVQVDPWSYADLSLAKPADLILITDDVGHHLDVKAIERLRKPGAPIVIAANGKAQVPDGIVLPNGQSTTAAGILVESIAAYDIIQGPPAHPKGEANG